MVRFTITLLSLALVSVSLGTFAYASTLDEIAKRGTIRVGYRESEPPMSFLDNSKNPIGFTIDLCNKIVTGVKSKLGKDNIAIEYVPVTSADRFEALTGNRIDILCGSTTKTLTRSENVDFTLLTFATGGSLMSLRASPVVGVSDLSGKKVAAVKDTTTVDALQKALKETLTDGEIVTVASASDGVQALEKGEVAAFASDQVVLAGLVMTAKDQSKFAVSRELFSYEPFALAVRRNDADFRLVANRVLSQLYRTGQIGPIYRKWFGALGDRMPGMVEALYRLNSIPE